MVNDIKPHTKRRLLELLRTVRETPVSGEDLASTIGVSRVAIWKAVKSLIEAGYPLAVNDKGYSIGPEASDDLLYPWEFGDSERLIHYWKNTSSTMDRARDLADKGAPTGTIAVAETQSAGRGRSGRLWDSTPGGLFFTLILTDRKSVLQYAEGDMRATAAAADAIERTTSTKPELRWPNDVYVGNRKIAGVLSEIKGSGGRLDWTLAGVGVNVNNLGDRASAISCAELAGRHISRRIVLNAFLRAFGDLGHCEGARLAAEWNSRSYGIGKQVSVLNADHGDEKNEATDEAVGTFMGIDELGRAMISTVRGTELLDPGTASLKWN